MTERMYAEMAQWWTLLSPVEHYVEDAALFKQVLLEYSSDRPRTLLELGSGGGHNAFHLKADFQMTLVDLSEDMLRQSRRLNPNVPHHLGDMRSVRLDKVFDAVFIHDAISHMITRDDLRMTFLTAFQHCRPGGVALFAPDETKERFEPQCSSGGSDDANCGLRYLEWCWDPDPLDETFITDYALMSRKENGQVEVTHDRHVHGLFPRQFWLDALGEAGFEAHRTVVDHSDLDDGYELFVGVKP